MKPVVNIRFTNGAGNNIFQYIFARLMVCAKGSSGLSHPALPVLGISEQLIPFNPEWETVKIQGSSKMPIDYPELLKPDKTPTNYDLRIYPEDFTLYTSIIKKIRSWFPVIKKTNKDDLVFHLRLGDRLAMSSTYKEENYLALKDYKEAIDSFDFKRLHIVTDMPVWRKIDGNDMNSFIYHRTVKPKDIMNPAASVGHFNSLYKGLMEYDPIVRVGNTVQSDFEYMRSFDKILFQHGTLAWWAAALSKASEVAVYGRWRGGKNINLGWTDLPGWRQWGRATAPQHDLKSWHLKKIAQENGLRTFVETGTKGGATLLNLQGYFDQMFSVEIIEEVHKKAKRRLSPYKHVDVMLGDSAIRLPRILKRVKKPALFWLDAHADREATPIMKELEIILSQYSHMGILVIDDSRYFGTVEAYPTKEQVEALVKKLRPAATIDYKFDTIRIWL